MRWCTDRLKIQPTSGYILQKVNENGKAIIVLGVRKDESATRKASIENHKNLENSNLTPHGDLKNALVYRPIADLSTDDVWEFLAANDPPWGGTHSDLIKLYREAAGGECPIVLSQEEAPGCGTNSSRFGCWTCTVVNTATGWWISVTNPNTARPNGATENSRSKAENTSPARSPSRRGRKCWRSC